MDQHSSNKMYDLVQERNIEENEERKEDINTVYFDSSFLNIKNIHNKRKDYR